MQRERIPITRCSVSVNADDNVSLIHASIEHAGDKIFSYWN